MGNREALIEGAKTCLREKGYTRTTARDIATTAGVSLAAIGYHFGSKDALLNEAMRQALGEWGDELGRTMSAGPSADAVPEDRFVAIWTLVADTLSNPASRALWTTQFELLSQGSQLPDLLQAVSAMQVDAREDLAALFGVTDADADADADANADADAGADARADGGAGADARAGAGSADSGPGQASVQQVGAFLQALLLGVVALTIFDPERAPRGEDLSASIQLMAAKLAR